MTEGLHRNQRSGITYAREKFKTRDTQRDSLDQNKIPTRKVFRQRRL